MLPTGTVTLLLADVEGSTRLWETQPGEMAAAIALLDRTLCRRRRRPWRRAARRAGRGRQLRGRVRPRRRRGRVRLGSSSVPAGPDPVAHRRAHRRRAVARRGTTTSARPSTARPGCAISRMAGRPCCRAPPTTLVADQLPADAWLIDLGTHPLRDLPRPNGWCSCAIRTCAIEFPPLRAPKRAAHGTNLPVQLDQFRRAAATRSTELRGVLAGNRLVTLTGAGRRGQDPAGACRSRRTGRRIPRRRLVRRPGADHPSRTWSP